MRAYEKRVPEIPPRRASPPNRASLPPYEQPVTPKDGSPFSEYELSECFFFQSLFEVNEIFCLFNKFALFTSQKQPLKFFSKK